MAKQKVTITPKGKGAPATTAPSTQGTGRGKVTITPKGKGTAPSTAVVKTDSSVPARQPSPLVSLLDFPPGLADGVRDVFMAGLGALATLEDEAQSLFSSLVKRGERWEAEARGARPEAEPDQAAVLAERLGRQLRTAVHDAVQAATEDRASHADLAALRAEVAALNGKLDGLARQAAPAQAESDPAAPEEAPDAAYPTLIEVRTADAGGWVVLKSGAPEQTLPTKAAATDAARALGAASAPAEIVLYKQDGTEQRRLTVDAD